MPHSPRDKPVVASILWGIPEVTPQGLCCLSLLQASLLKEANQTRSLPGLVWPPLQCPYGARSWSDELAGEVALPCVGCALTTLAPFCACMPASSAVRPLSWLFLPRSSALDLPVTAADPASERFCPSPSTSCHTLCSSRSP